MSQHSGNFTHNKNLFRTFYLGSVAVVSMSILMVSLILSWNTVFRERSRGEIARRQLMTFLSFHQKSVSEEMWTRNYDAIAAKISDVIKQFGSTEFNLFLVNLDQKCIYSVNTVGIRSSACTVPGHLADLAGGSATSPVLTELKDHGTYGYFAPLSVGEFPQGSLYLELKDPFQFYQGSIWSPAFTILAPNLIILSLLLGAWFLYSRRRFFTPYLQGMIEIEKGKALTELAAQVAHDIRSPLAALKVVSHNFTNFPEEERQILTGAVTRISDIASNLLASNRSQSLHVKNPYSYLVTTLIENLVAEKRHQYSTRPGLMIELRQEIFCELFAHVEAANFKTMISNVVDNSAEAIMGAGKIVIDIRKVENFVSVAISDTGKGIPAHVIPSLGSRGVTYGKEHGTGLGLFQVKSVLTQLGGRFQIKSAVNQGTTVTLYVPAAEVPTWFKRSLSLPRQSNVCIVDDDPSIHHIWRSRLSGLPCAYFTTIESALNWASNKKDEVTFLVDYEFIGERMNGLDLIERLNPRHRAVLVTSRFEDEAVLKRASELGIKVIPKGLASTIPLTISHA